MILNQYFLTQIIVYTGTLNHLSFLPRDETRTTVTLCVERKGQSSINPRARGWVVQNYQHTSSPMRTEAKAKYSSFQCS